MSLPMPWVDKIFMKLTLVYGRDFLARWEGLTIADVKTDWAHEMAGFAENPQAIAFALQNLPNEKPPNVYQFRSIARSLPVKQTELPAPVVASPDVIAAQLLAMVPIKKAPSVDGKEWARILVSRHEAGDNIRLYSLNLAKEALNPKRLVVAA